MSDIKGKTSGSKSSEFKVVLAGIIISVAVGLLSHFGFEIDPEIIRSIVYSILGITGTYVAGRSFIKGNIAKANGDNGEKTEVK